MTSCSGILVVYKHDEYIGDLRNMKFVPVYNYNSYYGDRKKRAASVVRFTDYPSPHPCQDYG